MGPAEKTYTADYCTAQCKGPTETFTVQYRVRVPLCGVTKNYMAPNTIPALTE